MAKKSGRPPVDNKRLSKSFTMPPALVEWIEAEAERTGESQSAVVVRVLKGFCGQN